MDFLRFLGVASVEELPDYDLLRSDENVTRAMENAVGPSIGSDVNDSKEEGKE